MEIITIDPSVCRRWNYADRAGFEFGNIYALAMDIKNRGQVEPVIARVIQDPKYPYEIIAGSRRWRACLENQLPLKAVLQNVTDQEALFLQLRENEKEPISDYSRGIHFQSLIDNKLTDVAQLAQLMKVSREKIYAMLSFAKIPHVIWDAVGNMSKVTARSATCIYGLSNKGEAYVTALISIADHIRKGIGAYRIEKLVADLVGGENTLQPYRILYNEQGEPIGHWVKNGFVFEKGIRFDQNKIEMAIIKAIS